MSLIDQLFGGELPTAVRFVIAFGVVLALIALTFVGLRRFAARKLPLSNAGGRARQPRLGVLDAFAIDARRRLVLIRRDNVEHLIMIGGPNDVLVESHIVRAPAQAGLAPQRGQRPPGEQARAAVQPPQGNVRAPSVPAPSIPAAEAPLPAAEAEPAPARSAAFRALQRPPAPPTAPAAKVPGLPPRAAVRLPETETHEPAFETSAPSASPPPAPKPAAPPAAKPKADLDPLYADIERKLGEALSRPPTGAPPAPPPLATPRPAPAAPAAPALRREPAAAAPPPAPKPAAPPTAPAAPPAAPKTSSKSHLDALEEEMASLLGRDRP